MYYPYLRGRQNELLAIRELSSCSLLSKNVVPIIEPVKLSPTLVSTVQKFNIDNRRLVLIGNPKVGSYSSDARNPKNLKNLESLKDAIKNSEFISRGWIVDKQTSEKINSWVENGFPVEAITCLCLNADNIRHLDGVGIRGYKSVIPYAPAFRRIRGDRILLEDAFNKMPRNADYAENEDEFFSNTHLYYMEDGFIGFSDYSIIGEEYNESGFAPHAVAIHIVYFDSGKELRVHHFVSKDSDDIRDPAGKFYQALTDLVEWNKTMKQDTVAIKKFEEIFEAQTYPGLGVIKKLSIMHHLELMSRFVDGAI